MPHGRGFASRCAWAAVIAEAEAAEGLGDRRCRRRRGRIATRSAILLKIQSQDIRVSMIQTSTSRRLKDYDGGLQGAGIERSCCLPLMGETRRWRQSARQHRSHDADDVSQLNALGYFAESNLLVSKRDWYRFLDDH